MADVFISYKSQRRRAAEHLRAILEANGFSVWCDFRGLIGGPDFGPQIERELRNAKAVAVLWCDLARESQWVREEADLAKKLGTYLPVLIDKAVEPPLGYRLNQAIDLRGWTGAARDSALDSLFENVERLVGRSSQVNRSQLAEMDRQWRQYGSPPMLGFPLEPDDEKAHPSRIWGGQNSAQWASTERFFTATAERIDLYNVATGARVGLFNDLRNSELRLEHVDFSSDGRRALIENRAGGNPYVHLYDLIEQKRVSSIEPDFPWGAIAPVYSVDGCRAVVKKRQSNPLADLGPGPLTYELTDLTSTNVLASFQVSKDEAKLDMSFSWDGKHLLSWENPSEYLKPEDEKRRGFAFNFVRYQVFDAAAGKIIADGSTREFCLQQKISLGGLGSHLSGYVFPEHNSVLFISQPWSRHSGFVRSALINIATGTIVGSWERWTDDEDDFEPVILRRNGRIYYNTMSPTEKVSKMEVFDPFGASERDQHRHYEFPRLFSILAVSPNEQQLLCIVRENAPNGLMERLRGADGDRYAVLDIAAARFVEFAAPDPDTWIHFGPDAYSRDGSLLWSKTDEGYHLWDARLGQPIRRIEGANSEVSEVKCGFI